MTEKKEQTSINDVVLHKEEMIELPVPKKFKRTQKVNRPPLLHISGDRFIGKMTVNGVKVEITQNHAVLTRRACITVFPFDSPNYMMLNQILQFANMPKRDEEQEKVFKWGCIFITSLTMLDTSSCDLTHTFDMYDMHLKYLIEEADKQIAAYKDDPAQNKADLEHVEQLMEELSSKEEIVSEIKEK